ncbi:sensor histidine kinase [Vagococcus vulneris]|nr:sensor histidine kinase [Vagococcus vulneris]
MSILKVYRDVYETGTKHLTIRILIQCMAAFIFSIFLKNGTLFIFTAWELGAIPMSSKMFKKQLVLYYLACLFSIVLSMIVKPVDGNVDVISIFIVVVFTIVGPIVSRSAMQASLRFKLLVSQNKRLEAIIQQNERDRIARDLHDNLGQSFSMITLKAELAKKQVDKNPKAAKAELTDIASASRQNLTTIREIVADLHEKTILQVIVEANKNLMTAGILLVTHDEDITADWPLTIQLAVGAIVNESVTNIIRHSGAQLCEMTFKETSSNYQIFVRDDGDGYEENDQTSFGLKGMAQRAEQINGTLMIENNHGTYVTITVPKESD